MILNTNLRMGRLHRSVIFIKDIDVKSACAKTARILRVFMDNNSTFYETWQTNFPIENLNQKIGDDLAPRSGHLILMKFSIAF